MEHILCVYSNDIEELNLKIKMYLSLAKGKDKPEDCFLCCP